MGDFDRKIAHRPPTAGTNVVPHFGGLKLDFNGPQCFDHNSAANRDMNSTKVSKIIFESSSFRKKSFEIFLTSGCRDIGSDMLVGWD